MAAVPASGVFAISISTPSGSTKHNHTIRQCYPLHIILHKEFMGRKKMQTKLSIFLRAEKCENFGGMAYKINRGIIACAFTVGSEEKQLGCEQNQWTKVKRKRGVGIESQVYEILLQGCIKSKNLSEGRRVHTHMREAGIEMDVRLGNDLVNMYVKCGSLDDARQVFDKMPERDVFSWSTMIAGCAQGGEGEQALDLFWRMQLAGIRPNQSVFESILRVCTSLEDVRKGQTIHSYVVKIGTESGVYAGNAFVTMYAKCGFLEDAHKVFDKLTERCVVLWSAMIATYAQNEQGGKAQKIFHQMQLEGLMPKKFTFYSVATACANLQGLEQGKRVHALAVKSSLDSDVFEGNAMYAKCNSIDDAEKLFDKMERHVASQNAMIDGYAQNGNGEEAVKIYGQMQQKGLKPNNITFTSVLSACATVASLEQGTEIHHQIINTELELEVPVGNSLIKMYCNFGSIEKARNVFDKMARRNVTTWTEMITGYAQSGEGEEALDLFWRMQLKGIKPNWSFLLSILRVCVSVANVRKVQRVHSYVVKIGMESVVSVASGLVTIYAKRGFVEDARKVFDKVTEPCVVLWSSMIAAYTQNKQGGEALEIFQQMQLEGIMPNKFTISSVATACANVQGLEQGKMVHALAIKSSLDSDAFVGNALVTMYAKCNSVDDAQKLFDKIEERDVVLWNAMIAGYAQNGNGEEALKIYCQMQRAGLKSNKVTFSSVLSACATVASLEQGIQIHCQIINTELESKVRIGNALITMYCKFGSIKKARNVFDKMARRNVATWTKMIRGYAQSGEGEEALDLFWGMQLAGIKPNGFFLLSLLRVCASLANIKKGQRVHSYLVKIGMEADIYAAGGLVTMYAKCGFVEDARKVFDKVTELSVMLWSAMIAAYSQNEQGGKALEIFHQMLLEGFMPNKITLSSVATACANLQGMEQGKMVHAIAVKSSLESDVSVGNALVNMYAKCKSLDDALNLFYKMKEWNVVSWNAMISGYAQNGNGEEALKIYGQMQQAGIKPDEFTFASVLSACAAIPSLEQGIEIHRQIINRELELDVPVGTTLIAMYCKCGSIEKARNVFDKMSMRNVATWTAMITGYVLHSCDKEAIELFEQMQKRELESEVTVGNALITMYAKYGSIERARNVFDKMSRRDVATWTAMITGYSQHECVKEAVELLKQMHEAR